MKIFNKWNLQDIVVNDLGLRRYINLQPTFLPKSSGRYAKQQFHKSKMNIVERLITKLMVPGHRGKKHLISSGGVVGKYQTAYKIAKKTFERIEEITKKNPIEVFVRAIENAALREEIAAYQVGGIIVRRAVITAPQRRIDIVLKIIVQSSYRKSFGKKEDMVTALANEIVAAYNNDASKSEVIKERQRVEREAEGAR
ncbi:MAG: 30S ribosomal protein S7 [Candidatus Aenigmarchaeota archaeon]|nr:30S ribosomal protein S7 [Candidatus Aenigmarchaeota archaeon]